MASLVYRPRSSGPQGEDPTPQTLLAVWRDGAAQHVAFGAGCACGADGVIIQLADFEQDIVDYLMAEAGRLDDAKAMQFLRQHGIAAGGLWSITRLLEAMRAGAGEDEVHRFILSRLGRSLESFASRHQFKASAE